MIINRVFDRRGKTLDEWRAYRRNGIGGSDSAGVLGMNPYMTPLAVYMDKLGLAPDRDENEAMRQGTDLEQYVADRFCEKTGMRVNRINAILGSAEYPWMIADPDRLIVGQSAGLECKTTSVLNKTEFDQGDIPATYYWQCMHCIAVTGAERWYLAVLVLNKAFYTFEIERNEEHIAYLIEQERAFWHDHVLARIPPAPSGEECDTDIIATMHYDNTTDAIDVSKYDHRIAQWMALKASSGAIEREMEKIKQEVGMALGNAHTGLTARYRVAYKPYTQARVDSDKLREKYPEVYSDCKKEISVRKMTFKEVKHDGDKD